LIRERAPRALLVVDAVHRVPHAPIDVDAIDCDALAFSTNKLFGPYAGVLWLRAALASRLDPYRVEPHIDVETLMETGTLDNVAVAGVAAALGYLREVRGACSRGCESGRTCATSPSLAWRIRPAWRSASRPSPWPSAA
jgi:selenocysteine lyase/cysteine desulfurase